MSHLHQPLRAPVERDVHLPVEASVGDGQMIFRDKLPVEPGVAPHLPVEVERGQGADRKVLGPGRGVIGDTPPGDVIGDFPMVGIDALDARRKASSRRTRGPPAAGFFVAPIYGTCSIASSARRKPDCSFCIESAIYGYTSQDR